MLVVTPKGGGARLPQENVALWCMLQRHSCSLDDILESPDGCMEYVTCAKDFAAVMNGTLTEAVNEF